MDWSVSEPIPEFAGAGRPLALRYGVRADLSNEETEALFSYQDYGLPQHTWRCFCGFEARHRDCYVINRANRDAGFFGGMCPADRELFLRLCAGLDSAIAKSMLNRDTPLIKGLSDPEWVSYKAETDFIEDNAYGSFSLKPEIALRYAGYNAFQERVFLQVTLPKGTNAIYMDEKEEEVLVFRGAEYVVDEIVHSQAGDFLAEDKAIVYILRLK